MVFSSSIPKFIELNQILYNILPKDLLQGTIQLHFANVSNSGGTVAGLEEAMHPPSPPKKTNVT